MFTVTIPTMWKYEPFCRFLCDLVEHPLVGEVIIVDNDFKNRPKHEIFFHEKIKLIDFGRNIFVNLAWNLGILTAKYDKVCVANDDIAYDLKVFNRVNNNLTPSVGVIGLSVLPCNDYTPDGEIRISKWNPGDNMFGFGMLFFVHKESFEAIPGGLDIYFGDNWVFDNSIWRGLPILLIKDIFYYSPYGQTGKHINHYEYFVKDKEEYRKVILSKGYLPELWCPEHYANKGETNA